MTIYTVHVPPGRRLRAGPDAARAVFVKEGFCWPGLFVALPWLLFRGMWIAASFYIIAAAGSIFLGQQSGLLPVAIGLGVFVTLLIGFEGNDLRRWSLGLRGYDLAGVVEAASWSEAEIRYFTPPVDPPAAPPPLPPAAPPAIRPALPAPQGDVIGFFPKPEGAA